MFKSPQQRAAYFEALKSKQGTNAFGATPIQHNAAIASSPLLPNNVPPKIAQPALQTRPMMANIPANPSMPINPASVNKFGRIRKII